MNIQVWRLLEGKSFNAKYKLKELLGFGAYGGVFLADEVIDNSFMRAVALKVILIDPKYRESQIKELQISTTLNHAHILRCFTSELGNPNSLDCLGLVMELGDESLDKRLAKGILAPDLVREMVKGWASALQNTHGKDPAIIHRDLKPANILRVGNDWKISDFGVARLVGGSKTASSTLNLVGSPAYMPPDAYNGEISPAFDVWSMGVMIVEVLTGNLPFYGITAQELQIAVQSQEPQIKGHLPAPFDQIVKGCLIKDRKQRWTCQRVIEALNPQPINIAPNIIISKLPSISAPPHVAPQRREIFAPANPKNLVLNLPNNQIIELVEIPAGSFMMGSHSKDEEPIHKVTLQVFRMGKYPITQKQYKAVMGTNPSHFTENENCPVEQVSWNNAIAFCQKVTEMTKEVVKLPSEAQWEYACLAGNSGEYSFGDDDNHLQNYAWYVGNSGTVIWPYWKYHKDSDYQTHAVGGKLGNNWNLHDMHGNVWEWCKDVWHDNYNGAPTDGSAWLKGGEQDSRVLRGGAWNDNSFLCRSKYRYGYNVVRRYNNLGFRVVV